MSSSNDDLSHSGTSSSSGDSLDEFHRDMLNAREVLGYQFQPRRDSVSGESSSHNEGDENMSTDVSIDEDQQTARLDNLDW